MEDLPGHNQKLFNARKTIAQMMVDRGYDNNENLLEMSKSNFKKLKNTIKFDNLSMELVNKRGDEISIIRFVNTEKFPRNDLIKLQDYGMDILKKKKMSLRLLLILNKEITTLKTYVEQSNLQHKVIRVRSESGDLELSLFTELWSIGNLQFNVTENDLVPKHILLTKDEADAILKEYKITPAKCPMLRKDDPQARYLGARTGDIVKIIYVSKTSGFHFKYRYVI